MNLPKTVVVRIPRKSNDPNNTNSELVEYRVTQEFLAGIVLEIIEKSSPEALSKFSEDSLEEVMDDAFEILNPPEKTFEERLVEYFNMIQKK